MTPPDADANANLATPPAPHALDGVFDAVVVGGGPAGATAAETLAHRGRRVLLIDPEGRIKPCGGAIPPRAIRDFAIPEEVLCARITAARMVAPSGLAVDMPIQDKPGRDAFVGMVDRATFDPWLRRRAEAAGAQRLRGRFRRLERTAEGGAMVVVTPTGAGADDGAEVRVAARTVIGADGATSAVARQELPDQRVPTVAAYHEIVRRPAPDDAAGAFDGARCDVYYQGALSPDFYGWVFPHGDTVSVGLGTAQKGFPIRAATATLRARAGLGAVETLRREGAPIPMRPLKRWDNGRDVVVAGDAAGVVAPASGEGIFYAMVSGRLAAEAVDACLTTGRPAALARARRRFMRAHGLVFFALGQMQDFWYANDWRRECFVAVCKDTALQRLIWISYMNKILVMAKPWEHLRIFVKNLGLLTGLLKP